MWVNQIYVARAELEDRETRFLESCILAIAPEDLWFSVRWEMGRAYSFTGVLIRE